MSGELLRVRMVRGCSMVTVVRRGVTPSSASTVSSQSPSVTRSFRLKRTGVALRVAPRPLIDSTGMRPCYAHPRTNQEQASERSRSSFTWPIFLEYENQDED